MRFATTVIVALLAPGAIAGGTLNADASTQQIKQCSAAEYKACRSNTGGAAHFATGDKAKCAPVVVDESQDICDLCPADRRESCREKQKKQKEKTGKKPGRSLGKLYNVFPAPLEMVEN